MFWRPFFNVVWVGIGLVILCHCMQAQDQSPSPETVQHILDRLDSLEKQNAELLKEIRDLRQELAGAPKAPPVEERVEALEQRTAEQAQTKISASQRLPISLTGMLLFDATETNARNVGAYNGNAYGLDMTGSGATLRQSIIGLEYYGPHIFGDGQIHGSLAMDFYSGTEDSVLRIRRGVVSFDWKRRSITFGQDKPLIAPWQPTSFAHVGTPPLAGAGNLWFWLPQATYEERIPLSTKNQLKLQASVIETNETYSSAQTAYSAATASPRPGAEARIEYQRSLGDQPVLTLGFGAHTSSSHVLGASIPSRVISGDFKYQPQKWLQLSGTFLHGENFANLGGLSPGVTTAQYAAVPIHASAGWLQAAFPVTPRLTFDVYAGRQLNAASDLVSKDPFTSLAYAANVLYRIASNVVLGFEGGQTRLTYLNAVPFSAHRFDATVAYLF